MSILSNIAVRERNLWIEVVVDVLVLIYFVPRFFQLLFLGDVALMSPAMGELITATIVYAIGLGVVLSILSSLFFTSDDGSSKDERELIFELRSYRFGYYVLLAFIFLLVGQVVIIEVFSINAARLGFELTPMVLVSILVLSISLSSLIQCGSQLFFYRRGY